MKAYLIAIALVLNSSNTFSKEIYERDLTIKYKGENVVSLCIQHSKETSSCKEVNFPADLGQVDHVVHDPFPYESPGIFVAFAGPTQSVCKTSGDSFRCVKIDNPSTETVRVGAQTRDGKSEIEYVAKEKHGFGIKGIQAIFNKNVHAAYLKLLTRPLSPKRKVLPCKSDCPASPMLADEDIPVVIISAPFPNDIFSGMFEIVEMGFYEGEPPTNVPEPIPDGVALAIF